MCSGKSYEISLLRHAGINYEIIPSGKYRRYGRNKLTELLDFKTQLQNLKDLPRILRGYTNSRKIIKQFQPDVVFVKGGFVSLPVGIATVRAKIPLIIHESDAVMGKTNSILAKRASAVAVSFPVDVYRQVDQGILHFTGNPVRSEYHQAKTTPEVSDDKQKPNILIFAGSQGAQAINKVIFDELELLLKNFNILHVVGDGEIERARFLRHRLATGIRRNYDPHSFLTDNMLSAYQWADIVVARAGMNSLSELSALSKPSIIIPLPTSTNDHQMANARYLARMGAIRILLQSDLSGVRLLSELSKLMADHSARQYLSSSIHKFYQPDAPNKIAQLVLDQGRKDRVGLD